MRNIAILVFDDAEVLDFRGYLGRDRHVLVPGRQVAW
jgi:hypothetical protein